MNINYFTISLLSLLVLGACKTTKSNGNQVDSASVQSAIWYNWSGGQPGVGGTKYEITLESIMGDTVELTSLTIDGKALPGNVIPKEDNSYMISSSENRSVIDESISAMNRRPDFRTANPETCQLVLRIDGKEIVIEVTGFEKGKSQNYP